MPKNDRSRHKPPKGLAALLPPRRSTRRTEDLFPSGHTTAHQISFYLNSMVCGLTEDRGGRWDGSRQAWVFPDGSRGCFDPDTGVFVARAREAEEARVAG